MARGLRSIGINKIIPAQINFKVIPSGSAAGDGSVVALSPDGTPILINPLQYLNSGGGRYEPGGSAGAFTRFITADADYVNSFEKKDKILIERQAGVSDVNSGQMQVLTVEGLAYGMADGTTITALNGKLTAVGGGGSGDIEGVTAGNGLTGGGTTGTVTINVGAGTGISVAANSISFDPDGGTLSTANADIDHILINDGGVFKRIAPGDIDISSFNNDSGFTTNTGDIEGVTAGNGLTGGGTTGTVTLTVGAGTGIDVSSNQVSVDVSDFMANGSNNRVLTAAGADSMNAEANLTFDGTDLTIANQGKIVFDTADTYIAANADTTEDLEIHANQDLLLKPDNDVVIHKEGVQYGLFDGSEYALKMERNTNAVRYPFEVRNLNTGTSAGIGIQMNLVNGSSVEKSAGRITVEKQSDWASDANTDANMSFSVVNDNSMTEKMRITGTGVGIGKTSGIVYDLDVNGNIGAEFLFLNIVNNSSEPYVDFARARASSPFTVQDDDVIGSIRFRAYDSNSYDQAAKIQAVIDGAPGNSDIPTRLEFLTTADGANSSTTRMVIKEDGKVGIGTTTPRSALDVPGVGGLILSYVALYNNTTQSKTLTTSFTQVASTDQTAVITFTAPQSGNIELQLSTFVETSDYGWVYFSYDTDTSYDATAGRELLAFQSDESDDIAVNLSWVITGLTAGTSYTYYIYGKYTTTDSTPGTFTVKWGGNQTSSTHASGAKQPLIIRAVALPSTIVQDN